MNTETVGAAVGQLNDAAREKRLEAERRDAERRAKEARSDAALEAAKKVMKGFRDFVVTAAPHDHDEPTPYSKYSDAGRAWAAARDQEVKVDVVLGNYDTDEYGPGQAVASVSPQGRPGAAYAASRYGDLDHVNTYYVGLSFCCSRGDQTVVVPLEGRERYSTEEVRDMRYNRDGRASDIDVLEDLVGTMEVASAETLSVLEAAARNPELNPDLAERFAVRAPLAVSE
jgi:hypothetical protein